MNITSENALEILNTIIEISPEFGKIIDMAAEQVENKASHAEQAETETSQNELLQQDQDLANAQLTVENAIHSYNEKIVSLRSDLNESVAQRLNLYKRLKEIKRKRDDIYSKCVKKFACPR